MAQSLVIGDDCVPNTIKINQVFRKKKVEQAKEFFGQPIESYNPCLGSQNYYNQLSPQKINSLKNANVFPEDPNAYLSQFRRLFSQTDLRSHFFPDGSGINVIDTESYQSSQDEIQSAIELMSKGSPWMKKLYTEVITDLLFVQKDGNPRFIGGGGSEYNFIGLILMSLRPESETKSIDLSISIAHELGHQVFFLLQAGMLPIEKQSWKDWVYSGVRQTERPAYASLHAVVALMYMLSSTRGLMALQECQAFLEHLKNREQEFSDSLSQGLNALKDVKLTDLGKIICLEGLRLL